MEFTMRHREPSRPVEIVGHLVVIAMVVVIMGKYVTPSVLRPDGLVMVIAGSIALRYWLWGPSRLQEIAGHILMIVVFGLFMWVFVAQSAATYMLSPFIAPAIIGAIAAYFAARYLLRFLRAIERIAAALDRISYESE